MERGMVGQQAVGRVVGVGGTQRFVGDSDRLAAECDCSPGAGGQRPVAGIRGCDPRSYPRAPTLAPPLHRAAVYIFVVARRRHKRNDIILDQLVEINLLDTLLEIEQRLGRYDLSDGLDRVRLALAAQDIDLIELLGVSQVNAQQEAVELRL